MSVKTLVAVAAGMVLLASCGKKPAAPSINASMTEVMEPQAQTIWDITSRAYNDVGDGLEPSKISQNDWAAVQKAGQALKDRALELATADRVTVTASGEKIMGEQAAGQKGKIGPEWDAASSKQVQERIEKNPALFKEKARALADAGDAFVRASLSKDAQLLYKVSSELDERCDSCHEPFWGTDEPPPVTH